MNHRAQNGFKDSIANGRRNDECINFRVSFVMLVIRETFRGEAFIYIPQDFNISQLLILRFHFSFSCTHRTCDFVSVYSRPSAIDG